MSDNYEALSDRERDALVAERIMGWRWRQRVNDASVFLLPPNRTDTDNGQFVTVGDMEDPKRDPTDHDRQYAQWSTGLPNYSTDDNAARLVRNKIAELRMDAIRAYQSELAQLVWPNGTPSTLLKGADHFAFSLQHATPRLQMIAALRAYDQLRAKESTNGR